MIQKRERDRDRVSKIKNRKGFSFLEIMIVIFIIGITMTLGARRLVNSSTKMKSSIISFSVLMKRIRSKAKIQNKTFRLVFELPDKNSKKRQRYWIESTDKQALLLTKEDFDTLSEELEEKETKDGKTKKPDPQGFSIDSQIIKEPPATLPKDLFFESIEINGDPIEEFKKGLVYIYFFPQGYVQTSAIHISDRKDLHWTLGIQGITGRIDIENKKIPLEKIIEEE